MITRLLKSTEMSTTQKAEREVIVTVDIKDSIVDTDDIKDSKHAEVTGKILNLELS